MKKTNKLLALLLSVMVLMSCFVPVVTVSAETTAPTATTKESWTVDYDFTTEAGTPDITDTTKFKYVQDAGTASVKDDLGAKALRLEKQLLSKDESTGVVTASGDKPTFHVILPGAKGITKNDVVHVNVKVRKSPTEIFRMSWVQDTNATWSTEMLGMLPVGHASPWMYLRDASNTYFSATKGNNLKPALYNGTDDYAEIDIYVDRKNQIARAELNGTEFAYYDATTGEHESAKYAKVLHDYGEFKALSFQFYEWASAWNKEADAPLSGPYIKNIYVGSVFDEIEEKITALANETDAAKKLRKAIEINSEIKEYTDLGYSTDKIENYADLAALLPDVTTNKASWTVDYDFTTEEDAAKVTNTDLFTVSAIDATVDLITDADGKTALKFNRQILSKSGDTVSVPSDRGAYFGYINLPEALTQNEMVHTSFESKKVNLSL